MPRRFQILALDIDGTLLDADGTLRPRTAAAIAAAARAGIRPILCTGRRYRRARPVAEQLGLDAPLVCNSGALVKDPLRHTTLWRADFDFALLDQVLQVFAAHEQPVISFTDREFDQLDFVVAAQRTGRAQVDEFISFNQAYAEIDPGWCGRLGAAGHFHLCTLGTRPEMLSFEQVLRSELTGAVQTFVQKSPRYSGTMCEVLRHDASKWAAVQHVAAVWGITPAQICAVGDDMNDIPMIQGAGLGVAMGHAFPAVKRAAQFVTGDHDHDGVAALVDLLLSEDESLDRAADRAHEWSGGDCL